MTGESEFLTEAKAWAGRCSDLARWVSRCLINRKDAWGRYTPVACRGTPNKRTGRLIGSSYTETKQALSSHSVARHFQCRAPEHVVGLFAISRENTCRWIVIDIDAHAAEVPNEVQFRNFTFAVQLWKHLRDLGFHPLLTDSNGRGGYHLRVVFSAPIPSSVAFRFAKSLIADWSERGFEEAPEVFPKRADRHTIKDLGGGWVRLPGRHHTREVVTCVWDGEVWLSGHAAIDMIIATTGDDASRIPQENWAEPAATSPSIQTSTDNLTNIAVRRNPISRTAIDSAPDFHLDDRRQMGRQTIESHPPSVSGERGHDNCFHLACKLVLGCNLSPTESLPLLQLWNAKCQPEWSESELIHKLTDADTKTGRRGYLLPQSSGFSALDTPQLEMLAAAPVALTLEEHRKQMADARQQSLGCHGQVFLDRSPTGTGKTSADIRAAAEVVQGGGRALFVAPVHDNCWEIKQDCDACGVWAEAYPVRMTPQKYEQMTANLSENSPLWEHIPAVNCWDEGNADLAQAMGLPVSQAVCFGGCPFLTRCRKDGYLRNLELAQDAPIGVVTHKRGEHQGLATLSKDRKFVAIHEDPTGLLRPTDSIPKTDLLVVQSLLNDLLNNPQFLNSQWCNPVADSAVDASSTRGIATKPNDIYSFLLHLSRNVDQIVSELEQAIRTVALKRPFALARPVGIERLLFRYCQESRSSFEASPWRGLLAWVAGQADELVIMVCPGLSSEAGKPAAASVKSVIVSWQNLPNLESTVWIGDSTADPELLQFLMPGRTIRDATPPGELVRQKKVIQIPRDISRKTSPKTVREFVRSVIYERPHARRVGVICHSKHRRDIEELRKEFGSRIARVTHYGHGDDRSSNCWVEECDLLICIGTPRPGPDAVRQRLVQIGLLTDAAMDVPDWRRYAWIGRSESGEHVQIVTKGYARPRWQQVFQSLCNAQLLQAVGRSRALLESGIDVVVISKEHLGYPVASNLPQLISDTGGRIVAAIRHLSPMGGGPEANSTIVNNALKANAGFSYNYNSNNRRCAVQAPNAVGPITTARISKAVSRCTSHVRAELELLRTAGIVCKVGKRGAWYLADMPPPKPE